MTKFLIIQTAFIGDVILATSLVEALFNNSSETKIDFLVRKGNEELLLNNPKIRKLILWDKKNGKYKNLFKILKGVRKTKYDVVFNLQRFSSSGFLTTFSKAKVTIGFDKNPFSLFFTKKVNHQLNHKKHEIERNFELIKDYASQNHLPKLYPSEIEKKVVQPYQLKPYVIFAPSSVWYTKQLPSNKWVELIDQIPPELTIFLIGAQNDKNHCESILTKRSQRNIINLCGKINLLSSAALIEKAEMTYSNDSAPLHLASAMNAPVTAFYCSTIPGFGFGPLSEKSRIIEIKEKLECRPCGLHGFKKCPKGHFKCGNDIDIKL